MKLRTSTRTAATAAVLVALTLGLTACGGADGSDKAEPSSENGASNQTSADAGYVYQFDQLLHKNGSEDAPEYTVNPDGGSVTIKLSEELREIAEAQGTMIVDSYTLTARAFQTGVCVLGIDINYADGGQEAVGTENNKATNYNKSYDVEAQRAMLRLNPKSSNFKESSWGNLIVTDEVPADDDLEKGKIYFASNYKAITYVEDCSGYDTEALARAQFDFAEAPAVNKAGSFPFSKTFAEVGIAVMDDGLISIFESRVDNSAKVTNTGKWALNEQQ